MPLDPPPRDANGEIVPHDHPGIGDGEGVIRRISPLLWVYDEKIQAERPSSMAVKPSSGPNGGMSVDLQHLIEEAGHDPKTFILTPPYIGALRFLAGALREQGLKVGYEPIIPANPFHGEVWGTFSKKVQNKLLSIAEIFVVPNKPK